LQLLMLLFTQRPIIINDTLFILTCINFCSQNNDGSHKISGDSLKDLYKSFVSECPIVSIEYPFDQDDWSTYAKHSLMRLDSKCRLKEMIFLSLIPL
jgi:uncharacterized protein YvpB